MNLKNSLASLLETNSISSNGTLLIQNKVSELMKNAGLNLYTQTFETNPVQSNLIGFTENSLNTKYELILQTHMDTVGPGDIKQWNSDPWKMKFTDEDRYQALGATDVKSDLVCKIHAAFEVIKENGKPKKPFAVIATAQEEVGMIGVKKVLNNLQIRAPRVCVGEPTSNKLVFAHKGYLPFEFEIELDNFEDPKEIMPQAFQGKSNHASRPYDGDNALMKMWEYCLNLSDEQRIASLASGLELNKIPDKAVVGLCKTGGLSVKIFKEKTLDIYKSLKDLQTNFESFSNKNFKPEFSTFSVDIMRMEVKSNKYFLNIKVDCRVCPPKSCEEIESLLPKGAKVMRSNHPYELLKDSFFYQDLKKLFPEIIWETKTTSAEASQWGQAGCDAIIYAPGVSENNSHCPNEWNTISMCEKAIEFYKKIILRYCYD